ncbi:MAG: hypothetical protein ACE5F1_12985 [Planctomycetota bacterium]
MILQTPGQQGTLDTEVHLRWLDAPPAWVLGLILVPAIVALIWWTYRRESSLTKQQRIVLAGLRILALLLVLVASFRPALETTRNLRVRTEVHFLIDDSASMSRHESYGPELAGEIMASLGPLAPPDLADLSRSELVALSFGKNIASEAGSAAAGKIVAGAAPRPAKLLLEALEKSFDLRWFRFSDRSYPISDLSELKAKAPMTRIGDSLDLHQTQNSLDRGKLEALIVITDGRNTEGLPPSESASRLRTSEIPVHVLGVGDPEAERNLILSGPPGPQQVLQNEEAVFELTVMAQGMEGKHARLELRCHRRAEEAGGERGPERTAGPVDFAVPADGEPRKVKVHHSFDEPGDYILTFTVPPLPRESNPKDNVTRRYLRVDSDRIRVLYLEDQPRWEYRYLHQALKRVDKSIEVQCFLFEASENFPQESSTDLASLTRPPRTKAELFKYHVVLLGDVPPFRLGATEESRTEWLELLKDFVEYGGGLGIIAGRYMPEVYRESTLEDLLPVVIDLGLDDDLPPSGHSFRPVPENSYAPHSIVRLLDDVDVNRRLWSVGLPGMYWYYPVLRAKAGATVLLRHPRDANKYGHRVLTCISPYPRGKVFFSAIDSVWRWRKGYGEKYVDRYWRQVVRSLAENRLRQNDDRVGLTVDREEVEIDTRVRVHLTLLDEDYNPILDQKARVHLRLPNGKLQPVDLPRLQGQAGEFESLVPLVEAGVFSFLYHEDGTVGSRPLARQDVIVRVPEKELQHASMNKNGLEDLAEAGGGVYAPLHRMHELIAGFENRGAGLKLVDRKIREVWDGYWTVLIVLLALSIEWILRKRWRLV